MAAGGGLNRDEFRDPEHPEIRDGERAAGQLSRSDRALASRGGQSSRFAADLPKRLAIGVEDRRDDQRVIGGDRDPDVDAIKQLEVIASERAVGPREVPEREPARFDDEVVVRRRPLLAGERLQRGPQSDASPPCRHQRR